MGRLAFRLRKGQLGRVLEGWRGVGQQLEEDSGHQAGGVTEAKMQK